MKDAILQFLRKQSQQHFNTRQLAHHLNLDSGSYKVLRRNLKELVHSGKIILHPEERYSARDVNKIIKGSIKIHSDGFGFLIPESKNKTDVFIPERYVNYAMDGDVVLVESKKNKRDGRFEGRVIKILERSHDILVGHLIKKGTHFYVRSIDAGTPIEIYVPQKHLNKAIENDLVAVTFIQYPGPGIMPVGEIKKVIGDESNDESLTEAILLKHNIHRDFHNQVRNEIQSLPDEVDVHVSHHRKDLSALPIMTIDGITAKDFDDAVCVLKKGKAYILYVSIADVAEYVTKDSVLDQEAFRRGTSTYLPNECIPMLPEKLSNGLCSLVPFLPRKTLTAEIHFNENFEFTRATYYKSLIKSKKRATYEEVQAYYDGTGDENFDLDIKKSLDLMKILAEALIEKAKKRGALGFDLPETEIVYDVHGKIQNVQKAQRFFSHKLIEVFMVAANVAVAQYFSVYGLPLMYRVHDEPDSLKLQNFLQFVSHLGLQNKLKGFYPIDFFQDIKGHAMESYLHTYFLRSLKQAIYDAENIGHYGLALTDYAHFTSPIRRYPDLVVHRQLRNLIEDTHDGILNLSKSDLKKNLRIKKKPLPYDFQDIKAMALHCSKRERASSEAEWAILDIRKAIFIRDFVHEKFFGRITRIAKFGIFVELDPYFVEGLLSLSELTDDYYIYDEKRIRLKGRRTGKSYKIGDRVWVTVSETKPEVGEINLSLAEMKPKKKLDRHKKKGRRKRR